jgi:hypothetical protein
MLAGIDHVIIACADPDDGAEEIRRALGLIASGGGRHEQHGTFNRLIGLGESYIELMGVFDATLAAGSWWGSHILALLAQSSSAYAGVPFATTDLQGDVARLRQQSSPISDPDRGERRGADGEIVRWTTARLPEIDLDLGLAFLIEHDLSAAEWRTHDVAERTAAIHPIGTTARLMRLELPSANVTRAVQRLHRNLGIAFRPSLAGGGARDASVGRQILRLIPSRGARKPVIGIRAGSSSMTVELLGCVWVLEPN